MLKIGLKVTLRNPENPADVINAQFATVRGNPCLRELLQIIADADVAENLALKKLSLAVAELEAAKTAGEADDVAAKVKEYRRQADSATCDLLEATRTFIERGFELAGASEERASELADCVGLENLQELKAKCLFGAGCLDFTKPAGQI